MKKQIITGAIVLAIILLLALPKIGLFKDKKAGEPVATAEGANTALQVEAKVIMPRQLDNKLVVTGSVQANESLELKSEVSGKVTHIYFKEGSVVKKGALLVQINDEEIAAQLLKERYNRKLNQDNEFRQRKLLEKDAISQEEYDNALNRLNTNIADIQVLQAQLEKTRLKAPFDGVIGLRYVSEGAYIAPNTIIATLYNNSPAKIEFAVPSRYSSQVGPGKAIFFSIESDTTRHQGTVYAIEPRIDPETRTLKIRALADNTSGTLLPGQFVKLELVLAVINNAIMIPTESVVPEQTGKKVYVVENGIAKEVKVETGIRTNLELEVLSGLNVGDTLLTTGLLQLRAGMPVQVVKYN